MKDWLFWHAPWNHWKRKRYLVRMVRIMDNAYNMEPSDFELAFYDGQLHRYGVPVEG